MTSNSCYDLLGVRKDAGVDELERAWTERRESALARRGELADDDVDALVARLDEAYEIVSNPSRSSLYGTYLKQTGVGSQVQGPEVFGALYGDRVQPKETRDELNETMSLPFGGPALQALADVVMAAPAPEQGPASADLESIRTGEIPPWLDRPMPTGDVPVSPPLPAEAHEENFLSNLEVQDRLGSLHNHLAAADLIRKERNELLRQVVKIRAELEMRTSSEVELRNALERRDGTMEELRRDLEHFRTVGEEALSDVLDLTGIKARLAEDLVAAKDKQEAAELTAKGARADLEAVRARVLQLEERIGGQDSVLAGERKVAESLRGELVSADKERKEAEAAAVKALEGYRAIDEKLIARDGTITELEGRLEDAARRVAESDTSRVEAEALRAQALRDTEAKTTQAEELQGSLDEVRAELSELRLRTEEVSSENRLQVRRVAEIEIAKSSLESDYETLRSTLVDARRALELAQQEGARQQERLETAEVTIRERESQHDEQRGLAEELREEAAATRLKIEALEESVTFVKGESESRLLRILELEGAEQVRQRELDEVRRSEDRMETDLEGARREIQRKADQVNQGREELRRQKEEYLNLRRQLAQRQNEIERLRLEVRGADKRHSQELQEVRYQADRSGLEQQHLNDELEALRLENAQQREQIRLQYRELAELAQQRDELAEVLEEDSMSQDELDDVGVGIMSLVRK